MADEAPLDKATARAALQGKRVALGVVIAMAVAFILATAVHVIPAVFGAWITPIASGPPSPCAQGLRDLARALDRDDRAPSGTRERDAAASLCARTPEGADAWAAYERLRIAKEQLDGRDPAALARLKRDLAAHFPSDMR